MMTTKMISRVKMLSVAIVFSVGVLGIGLTRNEETDELIISSTEAKADNWCLGTGSPCSSPMRRQESQACTWSGCTWPW